MSRLAYETVTASGCAPGRWMLFLHGILGTRANWRGFARAMVRQRPEIGALLVDLRMHGESGGFAPPHRVASCAVDLGGLIEELGLRVTEILGHSFGGKVALEYALGHAGLDRVWLIDSMPGVRARGSGSPLPVLGALRRLPPVFRRREEFVDLVMAAGSDRQIANWLAMNLESDGDVYRLRTDLDAIESMLEDYLARDDWPTLEQVSSRFTVYAIIAGRSDVWRDRERVRLTSLPEVRAHTMPNAGHWVHIDEPAGLLAVILDGLAQPIE